MSDIKNNTTNTQFIIILKNNKLIGMKLKPNKVLSTSNKIIRKFDDEQTAKRFFPDIW